MTDYYETRSQPIGRQIHALEIGTCIGLLSFYGLPTLVIKQEDPFEGRLSRTVMWKPIGETPLGDSIVLSMQKKT
jgi:hypothetical protein